MIKDWDSRSCLCGCRLLFFFFFFFFFCVWLYSFNFGDPTTYRDDHGQRPGQHCGHQVLGQAGRGKHASAQLVPLGHAPHRRSVRHHLGRRLAWCVCVCVPPLVCETARACVCVCAKWGKCHAYWIPWNACVWLKFLPWPLTSPELDALFDAVPDFTEDAMWLNGKHEAIVDGSRLANVLAAARARVAAYACVERWWSALGS